MSRALRIALAALVLVAAGAALLAFWVPRWVRSAGFETRLREAVREATGREARWTALEVGVWPPRVRVEQAALVDPGAGPDAAPALAVGRADLRLAPWPLLRRRVVVDRVVVAGARLRLVRSADGLALPWEAPGAGAGEARPGADDATARDEGGGFDLAVRRLDLREAHIAIEDRTLTPPLELALEDARAVLRGGDAAGEPVAVEAEGRLAGGGRVRVEGEATIGGPLDLEATLDEVALAPFAPYADADGARVAGRVSGTIRVRGPAGAPDALDADLSLADAHFRVGDAEVSGPVALQAELRGDLARPSGRFSIDATRAELVYGGDFRIHKPAGAAASAEGRLATGPDGRITTEGVRLRLRNLGGEAGLETGGGRPARFALDAPPFDVAGWGELLPAAAPLGPEGRIAFEGLRVGTGPLTLGGRVALAPLVLRPDGRGPIELRGALVGSGDGLRSEDLRAAVGGQPVALELAIEGLGGAPRHRVELATEGADASALLGALAGRPDALEGPVTLAADLRGPVAGADAALAGLAGRVRLDAGPGRIPGVAPLRIALGGVGALTEGRRGEALRRFYGEGFESLAGTFAIADGRARTDDLVLRYPGYALEVVGAVRLADRRLDARGRLVLEEELFAALAGRAPEPGARPRVLPLARVGGSLDAPEIAVEQQAVLALAATLATAGRRTKVERKIDEVLGEGAGRALLDGLFDQR